MYEAEVCKVCGAYLRKRDGKCGKCEYEARMKKHRNQAPDAVYVPCKVCGMMTFLKVKTGLCWSCYCAEKERKRLKERCVNGAELLIEVKNFIDNESDPKEFINKLKQMLEDEEG